MSEGERFMEIPEKCPFHIALVACATLWVGLVCGLLASWFVSSPNTVLAAQLDGKNVRLFHLSCSVTCDKLRWLHLIFFHKGRMWKQNGTDDTPTMCPTYPITAMTRCTIWCLAHQHAIFVYPFKHILCFGSESLKLCTICNKFLCMMQDLKFITCRAFYFWYNTYIIISQTLLICMFASGCFTYVQY